MLAESSDVLVINCLSGEKKTIKANLHHLLISAV